MSSSNLFHKKSTSTLDFGVDWSVWLNGGEIETHEWIVPVTITKVSEDFDESFAVIVVSGGTPEEINEIKSKITKLDTDLGECAPIYIKIGDLVC